MPDQIRILLLGSQGTGIWIKRSGEKAGNDAAGVGYAVNRGERLSKLNHYPLRK